MRIWPFAQLGEWADHKRRSREIRVVATWVATTRWLGTDGKPTGCTNDHLVEFRIDGNGKRSSIVRSTSDDGLAVHNGVQSARAFWRVHGYIPEDAWRADVPPRGKLVSITGGLAS